MNKAWNYCFKYLFCDKINLFYDHLYSHEEDGAISGLPSIEQINKQIPNPNGWSTGMEDSVICGSMMLDCAMIKKDVDAIKKIVDGLFLCSDCSDEQGFIARSVSPIDKKSHYSNSSRDQYTHFVYSFTHLYFSTICDEVTKQRINQTFIDIATRMEKNVIFENNYEFLREDEKNGLCFKMWGEIGKHEYLRLPMFYLAAFLTSKSEKYKDLYLKYRDEALEKSCGIDYEKEPTAYPILQMQYSLKFIYDFDDDKSTKEKCKKLMEIAQKAFQQKAFEYYNELLKCTDTLSYKYTPFYEQPAVYIGNIGGYEYNNHNQDIYPENKAYYLLRNIGDSVALSASTGIFDKELVEVVEKSASLIDYSNHYSNAPIYLLNGYWNMLGVKNG